MNIRCLRGSLATSSLSLETQLSVVVHTYIARSKTGFCFDSDWSQVRHKNITDDRNDYTCMVKLLRSFVEFEEDKLLKKVSVLGQGRFSC